MTKPKTLEFTLKFVTEGEVSEDTLLNVLSGSLDNTLDELNITSGVSFISFDKGRDGCVVCSDKENIIKQLKKHIKSQVELLRKLREDGAKTPKEREADVEAKQETINRLSAELGKLKRKIEKGRLK